MIPAVLRTRGDGSVERALAEIAGRAAAADRGETSLHADLGALARSGLLADVVAATAPGGDAVQGAALFRMIGRASLPVGRLVEGHANALKLIVLYGSPGQIARARRDCDMGKVFGVWGADGRPPVRFVSDGSQLRLRGRKSFCSGLGLVGRAVVVAPGSSDAPQLALADVEDPSRANAAAWRMSGMRATVSGTYDFDDVVAEPLGALGDFQREPHFEGGVWRYAALHVGGLEALAEATRAHIVARGQAADPHQAHRLAQIVRAAETGRLWVEAAASAVEAPDAAPSAVPRALLAREAVEAACLDAFALADRALGTAGFVEGSVADRIRRDLGLFLRQANLDGKLMATARFLAEDAGPVGTMW